MLTTKEILFFLLIMILMIVSAKGVMIFTPKKVDKDLMSVFGAFVTTIILLIIYKSISVCESSDQFSLSDGFRVTPEKLCDGGEYMLTSAPKEVQEMCAKLANRRGDVSCNTGFHGRPVHFEYSAMSDDNWQNTLCDDEQELTYMPKVL